MPHLRRVGEMNVWLFGARPGACFRASAGANRGVVVLDATAVVDPDAPLSLAASGKTIVLTPASGPASGAAVFLIAREGDAGTWHGIGRATPTVDCPGGSSPAGGCVCGHHWRGWETPGPHRVAADPVGRPADPGEVLALAQSTSNGGDHVVAVVRLRPGAEPLHLLTSGYDGRRGWTVHTLHSHGQVETARLDEWRARQGGSGEAL